MAKEMDNIKTAVSVGTTKQTLKDLDVNLAMNKNNVDVNKLIGQPFLSKSALCHAIFVKFNENPDQTLEFLNLK